MPAAYEYKVAYIIIYVDSLVINAFQNYFLVIFYEHLNLENNIITTNIIPLIY